MKYQKIKHFWFFWFVLAQQITTSQLSFLLFFCKDVRAMLCCGNFLRFFFFSCSFFQSSFSLSFSLSQASFSFANHSTSWHLWFSKSLHHISFCFFFSIWWSFSKSTIIRIKQHTPPRPHNNKSHTSALCLALLADCKCGLSFFHFLSFHIKPKKDGRMLSKSSSLLGRRARSSRKHHFDETHHLICTAWEQFAERSLASALESFGLLPSPQITHRCSELFRPDSAVPRSCIQFGRGGAVPAATWRQR